MSLTIAIITNTIRRDVQLVEKSLKASLGQPGVQAVILIDQNETPLKLSIDLTTSPLLKIIRAKVPAVSQARNLAVYPEVDWLIFCDDDGYIDSGYVYLLGVLLMTFPKVEIICGSIKRIDTGDFYSKRHAIGGDMKKFWNSKLLMGSNFCVKRTVFEALGKFDEGFGAGAKYGSSEETDFAWNAFFHDIKMIYAPELVVFHVPPFEGALWPEMKKAFRYGRGKSALIRKWLLKGYFIVLLELIEMLLIPCFKMAIFIFLGKFKECSIQLAAFSGRIIGILF